MSINITFSMHARRKWFGSKDQSQSLAKKHALELSEEMGYQCDIIEEYLIFQFCPEGFLWMRCEGRRVIGSCQTSVAGPGFHRAVILFMERLALRAGLKLRLEDPTGYYEDRDFKQLRSRYFYRWFRLLMEEALKQTADGKEQLLCWPVNYYWPQEHAGTVITHIRRFTFKELQQMIHSGVTMAFAKDFFIWTEEEKDAYYYRNCALVLSQQECYFRPSERSREDAEINQAILELFEKALELDDTIYFPTKLYLELCDLAQQAPVVLDHVEPMNIDFEIGCRRELVYRTIGNVKFAVPGHYLHDKSTSKNSERYYDNLTKDWHEYYICAVNTKEKADFHEHAFAKDNVVEVIEFQAGTAEGKIAVYAAREKNEQNVFNVSAQIVYETQTTIVSISYTNPADQGWAVELIQKIRTVD